MHATCLMITIVPQKSGDDANQLVALIIGECLVILSSHVQLFTGSAACRHVCGCPAAQQISGSFHRS